MIWIHPIQHHMYYGCQRTRLRYHYCGQHPMASDNIFIKKSNDNIYHIMITTANKSSHNAMAVIQNTLLTHIIHIHFTILNYMHGNMSAYTNNQLYSQCLLVTGNAKIIFILSRDKLLYECPSKFPFADIRQFLTNWFWCRIVQNKLSRLWDFARTAICDNLKWDSEYGTSFYGNKVRGGYKEVMEYYWVPLWNRLLLMLTMHAAFARNNLSCRH